MSLGTDGRLAHFSSGPLQAEFPVWGLFGRMLLAGLGFVLIIPSPWTSTILYKFIADHVALPGGRRLSFAGQPGDIWYVFVGMSAISWLHGAIGHPHSPLHAPGYLSLIGTLAAWALTVVVLKWFCAMLKSEDGQLSISFEGGYLPYIGWNLLLILSLLTIVGWAWVLKFMMRWICRNVRGTASFDFTASGWDILWRSVVCGLAGMLIIPIPWLIRWYQTWIISQISVGPPGASAAA